MEALDICSSTQSFCNLFPVLPPIYTDSFCKFLVLRLRPVSFHLDVVALMVLGSLVLSRPTLVEMGVQHLVPNQLLLSLTVSQIIQIARDFRFQFTLCIL